MARVVAREIGKIEVGQSYWHGQGQSETDWPAKAGPIAED
jgi:hypothetical protein